MTVFLVSIWLKSHKLVCYSILFYFIQISCQVGQSVILGYLANSFNEDSSGVGTSTNSTDMTNSSLVMDDTAPQNLALSTMNLLAAGMHIVCTQYRRRWYLSAHAYDC